MSVKLICGDCLQVMPTLPDKSVDMILADLPYGTTACSWDVVIPFEPLWAQYKRLIKPRGAVVLFGSQPFTSLLVASNLAWFKYCWVWNKNNSAGFAATKYRPFVICEDICVFANGATTYNPQMEVRGKPRTKGFGGSTSDCYGIQPIKGTKNNIYYPKNLIELSKVNQRDNDHPTQKPVALLEYLIRTYTNAGDTVLDNTMGSGSTLVACVNTDRNGIGIELRRDYFEIAERRVSEAQMQTRMELHV